MPSLLPTFLTATEPPYDRGEIKGSGRGGPPAAIDIKAAAGALGPVAGSLRRHRHPHTHLCSPHEL